jgi:hypothetical protein
VKAALAPPACGVATWLLALVLNARSAIGLQESFASNDT